MIRGFLTGVIWGGVVAAAGLAVMSQVVPLPGAPSAPQVPEVVEPVAAPEPLPAAPEPAEMPEILQKGPEPEAEPVAEAAPPVDEADAPPPAAAPTGAEPESASAPEAAAMESPAEPAAEEAQPADSAVETADLAPPAPMTAAPAAPALPDMAVAEAPAPASPVEPELQPLPAAPTLPVGEPALPQQEAPPAPPDAPREEAILTPAPAEDDLPAIVAPVEPEGGLATLEPEGTLEDRGTGVTTDRLPRIGDAPAAAADEGMAEAVDAPAPEGSTPLDLFARPFTNDEGKPLFVLMLIDEGADAALRAEVAKLPFPVTFVLDPLVPESATAAKGYRSAGQEVAMLATGLPAGATAADMEQSFQALDMALPEAVAVVDAPEGGFQESLDLARQAVPIVADQGRGLLTYDRGLNPADQVARREGVPSAVIFRILDSEGESVPKMRNYLDRAAFKAAQDGTVVVIGRLRPDTVAAILEWTVEGRAASVALAPVSAVLKGPTSD